MANNRIQVKRTSVSGRTANTTDSGNGQYIAAGEFALNMADGILYTSNGSVLITVGANQVNQSVTGNLTVKAIIANGSLGSANQVLTTNSTGVYWSTPAGGGGGTVTSVGSGNGLTGGPITNSGTISLLANNGITANSTGTFVTQGTGVVVNATGVHVNSAYINTISANSATFVLANNGIISNSTGVFVNGNNGLVTNSTGVHVRANNGIIANSTGTFVNGNTGVVVNSTGVFVNSAYINTISSNNAAFLGGVAAASYVNTTGNYSLSGNITFTSNVIITRLVANGSLGSANQVLTSNSTGIYWSTPAGGSGGGYYKGGTSSVGTLASQGQNIFRVNANTLNTNTTFVAGENGQATGPVAIASGVTLTIETGARVSIV